jgi:hypothetical protein
MSQLEHHAKPYALPFIRNANKIVGRFSEEQYCFLSAWIMLPSIVFDALADDETEQYYTYLDRLAFADSDTLSPLLNTYIWLAPFSGQQHNAHFTVINKVSVAEGYGVHVMTAIINQVAIKFVSWKGHDRRMNFRRMNETGWNNIARRIWPAQSHPVHWPPPSSLTDQRLSAFVDAFRPS